jgi:predicted nucleotidyltransferase
MTGLELLAFELDVSGRTLRRAAGRGAIRTQRPSARGIRVTTDEAEYLRRHWPLLSALTGELRTLPDVRLAVLFGSAARGELREDSDLDVLIRLGRGGLTGRAEVLGRLETASGRRVQLVDLDEAAAAPLLLADVLRDGRVLVDRDGDWPGLRERESEVRRQAEHAGAQLTQDLWSGLEELGVVG